MNNIEPLVSFFSIVYGLILADLFKSLHNLIRNRKIVIWNSLSFLAAWYLFLLVINNWWDMYININSNLNIVSFFFKCNLLIIFYLSASTVLPDKIPKKGIDLKEYYYQNSKYFWLLVLIITLYNLVEQSIILEKVFIKTIDVIFIFSVVILMFFKKYKIHYFFLSLFIVLILIGFFQR